MNREDIIKLAREAGFYVDEKARQNQPNCISHTYHMIDNQLECFAALVADAEREACAQVCDEYSAVGKIEEFDRGWLACAKAISNVIRARGQA